MAKNDDANFQDLDALSGFVLNTIRTGKVDLVGAVKIGGPLKRQAGNMDKALGHLIRRYSVEDEKAAAMLELAKQQSPAFAKLAERWGLGAKDADAEVVDVRP
jgi:hypothetical protein